MVEGRPFVIFADQKPLTLSSNADTCSPRQFRHQEFIGQFSTDSRHVSGQDNVVADVVSKVKSVITPLDYHALASSQDQYAELQDILQNGSALRLARVHVTVTAPTFTVTHPLHNRGHS
jgi:hypothetical protein